MDDTVDESVRMKSNAEFICQIQRWSDRLHSIEAAYNLGSCHKSSIGATIPRRLASGGVAEPANRSDEYEHQPDLTHTSFAQPSAPGRSTFSSIFSSFG